MELTLAPVAKSLRLCRNVAVADCHPMDSKKVLFADNVVQ
jgi:hypothetical protein